jgi:hypothetical protein
MEQGKLLAHCGSSKITREELKLIPTPEASATHQPIPHNQIVEALVEGLNFRHISAIREEYAVSNDGMKMFGVLDLETTFDGCRFSVGIRNANDKSMRLALTVGYRVLVCDNMAFSGDFTPMLAKRTQHLSLVDVLSVGIDWNQRNFEPMKKQVEAWKATRIPDEAAKLVIYRAFVEGELDVLKHLARRVHDLHFNPQIEEIAPKRSKSKGSKARRDTKFPRAHSAAAIVPCPGRGSPFDRGFLAEGFRMADSPRHCEISGPHLSGDR